MSFILASYAFYVDLRRSGRDDSAPVRKLILQAFCHEAQDNGLIAPRYAGKTSNDRLAAIAMRGVSAVKEAKKQLIEDGWLIAVGRARRGQGKVALYRVNVDKLRANIRAREAEIFAVEPDERGTPVYDDDQPSAGGFSGRKSDQGENQGAENQAEKNVGGRDTGHDNEMGEGGPGLVAGSSALSGRGTGHNPISPSPPYNPPPSGSDAEDRLEAAAGVELDWRQLRDELSKRLGSERARTLMAGARVLGGTVLFADRFKFADARDVHADLLGEMGVRVIAMDAPRSESVALSNIVNSNRRAAQ